jgi:hypothetical protein
MTPKEKAKELVDKLYDKIKYIETSKDCASIAANEILNNKIGGLQYNSDKQFWKDVKKEIKKL